jgi:ankyrin repeat protein
VLEQAKAKNLPLVMRLLQDVSNYTYDDGTSEGTLLHYAAFHGWINLMDSLIKMKGANVSQANKYDKRTPLLSACRGGKLDAVKYCVKNLKKIDWSASNENGMSCSHFAAREGHPEILSYMIELNKLAEGSLMEQSLKADNKLHWTPLHYASNNGHQECAIVLLLEAGANPYQRGYRRQSAIDLARARGDKTLVDIMVRG